MQLATSRSHRRPQGLKFATAAFAHGLPPRAWPVPVGTAALREFARALRAFSKQRGELPLCITGRGHAIPQCFLASAGRAVGEHGGRAVGGQVPGLRRSTSQLRVKE